jgi:hypothetical protein
MPLCSRRYLLQNIYLYQIYIGGLKMNKRNWIFIIFLLVISMILFAGCDDTTGEGPKKTNTPQVTVAPTEAPVLEEVTLEVSDIKVNTQAKAKYTTNLKSLPEGATITYVSSDTSIIEVDIEGNLSAKKEGSADITITIKIGDIEVSDKKKINVVGAVATEYNFDDLEVGTTLYDDFNWNNVGAAEIVEVEGGKALQLSGNGYTYVFIGEDFADDFTVEAKLKVTTHVARGGAQINFREDSDRFTARNGYQACIGDGQNQEYGIELRKRDTTISDIEAKLFEYEDRWLVLKVEMQGDVVKAYIDGEQVLSHDYLEGFDQGSIVVCSYLDTVQFDYIKITK